MTLDESKKIAADAASKLGEHFDVVLVIGSWYDEGVTKFVSSGVGNHFARTQMAQNYADTDLAIVQANEIAARIAPPEDDSELWKK